MDLVYSVRRIREDLALLDIPVAQATILPGHGWRPPDIGFIKINVDGAINSEAGLAGAGGVARSSTALIASWCKPHVGVTDPLIAEALSLWEGVLFARLRGFLHVIMETDCLEIVNLRNTRHNSRSVVVHLLVEIGDHALSFDFFVIQHVNMSANILVHLCAKRASSLMVTESWHNSKPSFLISSLMADDTRSSFV